MHAAQDLGALWCHLINTFLSVHFSQLSSKTPTCVDLGYKYNSKSAWCTAVYSV